MRFRSFREWGDLEQLNLPMLSIQATRYPNKFDVVTLDNYGKETKGKIEVAEDGKIFWYKKGTLFGWKDPQIYGNAQAFCDGIKKSFSTVADAVEIAKGRKTRGDEEKTRFEADKDDYKGDQKYVRQYLQPVRLHGERTGWLDFSKDKWSFKLKYGETLETFDISFSKEPGRIYLVGKGGRSKQILVNTGLKDLTEYAMDLLGKKADDFDYLSPDRVREKVKDSAEAQAARKWEKNEKTSLGEKTTKYGVFSQGSDYFIPEVAQDNLEKAQGLASKLNRRIGALTSERDQDGVDIYTFYYFAPNPSASKTVRLEIDGMQKTISAGEFGEYGSVKGFLRDWCSKEAGVLTLSQALAVTEGAAPAAAEAAAAGEAEETASATQPSAPAYRHILDDNAKRIVESESWKRWKKTQAVVVKSQFLEPAEGKGDDDQNDVDERAIKIDGYEPRDFPSLCYELFIKQPTNHDNYPNLCKAVATTVVSNLKAAVKDGTISSGERDSILYFLLVKDGKLRERMSASFYGSNENINEEIAQILKKGLSAEARVAVDGLARAHTSF